MPLISAKVDGEFKQRLIARCERNIIKLRGHSRSDYSRGPEGVISIIPVQNDGRTVVTGAVRRTRFVLLSLFRFLLLSVSQLVKTATALGAHLMTRRVETKDSFAKRQVYVADKLDETALSSHPSSFVRFPLSTWCTLLPRRRTITSYSSSNDASAFEKPWRYSVELTYACSMWKGKYVDK